jgi:ubiquinone/menaquinone biosynthesis C-methylase UbiE
MPIPLNDLAYVKDQYRDGTNLDARIALHARFTTAPRPWTAWVFDHLDLQCDARVLEIGCGTGLLWRRNRERIPASWRLMLTDFSFGMVETARAAGVVANFVQTDAQAVPFPDEYFDAVIANHMLYHVPDLLRALLEIRRVLKPGGKFFATTNSIAHMREVDELTSRFGIHPGSATLTFTLENGEPILAKHFASVRRIDFTDTLVVTQVEPLAAYVFSMSSAQKIRGNEDEQQLRQLIAERIAREGAFRITNAAGLFVATKEF